MRNAILTLLLVGCVDVSVDDEHDVDVDPEEEVISAAPTHNPEFCPGGSGGPGGKPIPAPRDCSKEPTWEQCYDCCDWNSKHVWEETCKRLPPKERAACWRRVESELRPKCYYEICKRPNGPITTVAP